MADESNQEIIEIKYVVIADKAAQDAEKLHERTKQAVIDIQNTTAKSGASFKEVATAMKAAYGEEQLSRIRALRIELSNLKTSDLSEVSRTSEASRISAEIQKRTADYKQYKTAVTNALTEINAGQKQVTASTKEMGSATSALGTIGKFVFGSILGITAVSVLRSVINYFKEATKAGFEYAQALLRLEASTQILQESGMNITMKETLDLIKQLNQEFPIFTRKQIVEGVGYIQLLSQNLNLTNDQMKNLAEVSGALAVVLGKDVNEASKELALFLSSGYGEALQRAGILASKASVQHELLAMGIKTGYNETDAATRAQAGYNVIMQQSQKIVEKAVQIQNDQAFSVTKSKNAWEQMKDTLGLRLVPVMALVYEMGLRLLQGINGLAGLITLRFADIEARLGQVAASIKLTYKVLSEKPSLEGLKEFSDDWNKIWSDEGFKNAQDITRKALLPDIFTDFTDSAVGAGSAVSEATATIEASVEDLYTKLKKEQDSFISDSLAAEKDFQNDLKKIDDDGNVKRGESWLEYFSDMAAIWRKSYDDIIGENIKFQLDLEQINRDYVNQVQDTNQKYRDKEYKAQKDFEEKMRRLREEFLFDLEDALRERDARQVLRLIRRFNLDQARLERERASDADDRRREQQRELQDLERQKAEKLQKLREEHQARLAEIKRQEAIELRELQIKHEAELAEIDRKAAQEKADREARYKEQQEELETQFKDRLREIGEGLADEYGLTKEMLDKIVDQYYSTYGPNGRVQQIYDYILAYARQVAITMAAIGSGFGGYGASTPTTGNWGTGFGGIPSYATGAQDMLVTSPQIIQVGEIPEIVNITPLNRMSSAVGNVGDKSGTITIELVLSPDLQARVINDTMNQISDVMLNIQRRR